MSSAVEQLWLDALSEVLDDSHLFQPDELVAAIHAATHHDGPATDDATLLLVGWSPTFVQRNLPCSAGTNIDTRLCQILTSNVCRGMHGAPTARGWE
jgi:hypothetical protein